MIFFIIIGNNYCKRSDVDDDRSRLYAFPRRARAMCDVRYCMLTSSTTLSTFVTFFIPYYISFVL